MGLFFWKLKGERLLGFEIENAEEVNNCDPEAVLRLELALPKIGALPAAGFDVRKGRYIVALQPDDPSPPSPEDILMVFAQFGFKAHFKGEP